MDGEEVLVQGKVDADVSVEEAHEAARLTGLSIFASLKQELGDLDRVTGWVKALGLVNCSPGFSKTPAVINGFSELVLDVWGDAGHHARSAIGAVRAPLRRPGRGRGDRRDTPPSSARVGRRVKQGRPRLLFAGSRYARNISATHW